MTKQFEVLNTSTKDFSSNTNNSSEQMKKEGQSLFDSLLSEASTQVEEEPKANPNTSKQKTETKTEEKEQANSKNQVSTNKESSKVEENKEKSDNTITAKHKEDVKEVKAQETIKDSSPAKNDEKPQENAKNNAVNLNKVIIENKTNDSKELKKESSQSLFDSLLSDASTELEEEKKVTQVAIDTKKEQSSKKNNTEINTLIKEQNKNTLKNNKLEVLVDNKEKKETSLSKEIISDNKTDKIKSEKTKEPETALENKKDKTKSKKLETLEIKKEIINTKENPSSEESLKANVSDKILKIKSEGLLNEHKQDVKISGVEVKSDSINIVDSKTNVKLTDNEMKTTSTNTVDSKLDVKNNDIVKETNVTTDKVQDTSSVLSHAVLNNKKEEETSTKTVVELKDEKIVKPSATIIEDKKEINTTVSKNEQNDITSLPKDTVIEDVIDVKIEKKLDAVVNVDKKEVKSEVKEKLPTETIVSAKDSGSKIVKNTKEEVLSIEDELKKFIQDMKEQPSKESNKKTDSKNQVLANMYLRSQKITVDEKVKEVGKQGKEIAKNASNIDDIALSAKTLDLGLKNIETTTAKEKPSEHSVLLKEQFLDRLAFTKNIVKDDLKKVDLINEKVKADTIKQEQTNSIVKSDIKANIENNVQISVSPTNVLNIESKIIGAKQQLSSMMSDIAREMYRNYKPPVTAFRINLLPSHLGSISIMMKSDKDKAISISLNVSHSNTLDAMVDSQASLRTALSKNFENDTNFSLDFSMQDDSSSNSTFDEHTNQDSNFNGKQDDEQVKAIHHEEEIIEDNSYM